MFARLQSKIISAQDEQIAQQQSSELDWISSTSKTCFRDELAPVITQSIAQTLHTHVAVPYQSVTNEYLHQQAENDRIIYSYLDRYEKEVMQEQLGLQITKTAGKVKSN